MKPKEKFELIQIIAHKLPDLYNVTRINGLFSSYGMTFKAEASVNSKRNYIETILSIQDDDKIIALAKDHDLYEGETPDLGFVKPQPNKSITKEIFISHSTEDRQIALNVIALLRAIGMDTKSIFCSSVSGYGIPLGENFLDYLRNKLNSEVLVIFLLSPNFYKSYISLCEMGAAWVTTREHIPVLIPPLTFDQMKGVFPQSQGMMITDPESLNSLKEKIEGLFGLTPVGYSIWERDRNQFSINIEKLLETS